MTCRSGFTLIELSIVLLIIGLLAGGILLGRDLIRAAELRSVITDIEHFKTAVHTFRTKYNCLPGDCANATDFWGVASWCPGGVATAMETCDGNGDGYIEGDWSDVSNENFRAWQQMANAGLISGRFTGVTGGGANEWTCVPGVNVPASRIVRSGYNWNSHNTVPIRFVWDVYFYNNSGIQFLEFGAQLPNDDMEADALSPVDAHSIDQKGDDGRPGTGTYTTFKPTSGYNVNCATTANAATAEYRSLDAGPACSFIINMEF